MNRTRSPRPSGTLSISLTVTAIIGLQAGLGATAFNDRFADRIVLTGTNVTVAGSNTNASKEGGEPDHAGNPGGKSVWWSWTAPTNGEVRINTDGSTFDTLLGVYAGSEASALRLVASNDDHGLQVSSRVRFVTSPNTSYEIAVDGYNDGTQAASGDVILSIEFFSDPIARPINDYFTNCVLLSGLPVTVAGSNQWATREAGEPYHVEKFGDTSVWWTWTALTSGWVWVSTAGSTFDTMLAVYQEAVLTNLSLVATNDDINPVEGLLASALAFQAGAGQTYQIAVDGFDGAYGEIVLTLQSAAPRLLDPTLIPNAGLRFTIMGIPEMAYDILASTDLLRWDTIGSVQAADGISVFTDSAALDLSGRFYQAVQQPSK